VKWTTFSPGTGESFTYGSLLGDPGAGTITSVLKAGAGTTVLDANHTFTGQTMVSEGVLELAGSGRLSGTSKVTVNAGGTLFFSGAGGLNTRVNAGTPLTLNGGALSTAGVTTSLDQQFGALTLSQNSTIDLSLLAVGNTVRFADSSAAEWAAGKTLRIFNYTSGVDHVFFGTDSSGLTSGQSGQLNAIQFYSDSGVTLIGAGSALQYLGSGEIVPSPVPEPSSLVVAMGMCGLIAWREGRTHRGRVRRAGRGRVSGRPVAGLA
jgi:autotransporter-associated beta strand protein